MVEGYWRLRSLRLCLNCQVLYIWCLHVSSFPHSIWVEFMELSVTLECLVIRRFYTITGCITFKGATDDVFQTKNKKTKLVLKLKLKLIHSDFLVCTIMGVIRVEYCGLVGWTHLFRKLNTVEHHSSALKMETTLSSAWWVWHFILQRLTQHWRRAVLDASLTGVQSGLVFKR